LTTAASLPSIAAARSVLLDDLKLTGLRNESAKEERGPPVCLPELRRFIDRDSGHQPKHDLQFLHSIIDVSQGIGGELKHAIQDEPVQPLIPLGSTGQLQGVQWQVVGFQHRMGDGPERP
jgi:hypothetical protein